MIHVYYGNGKGKTTAALGLLLRAYGRGRTCVLAQFLKDCPTGELSALDRLGVTVLRGKAPGHMFAKDMTAQELSETRRVHNENLSRARELSFSAPSSLLVLDELMDAISLGLVDECNVQKLLWDAPEKLEVVITGHKPIDRILELADYVTEMRKVRHPYDRGTQGRNGVEF
ncbi:MAG: cob(I)yrinic acid a,c-diamide adenosyltransferase [Oscillospiraceae bacterium]|jgi:cob(I)alamin adenosyltransferase|nr:cob(I)yrinic acid a,c-diamide adenosyltransferase [Oscillospiraceae bacterium]